MEIKVFKINIKEDGTYSFLDKRDQQAFNRTLVFLNKQGINKIELCLNTIEEDSTDRQRKLFKVLCQKISQESGMYSYQNVALSFLSYFGFSSIDEFPKDKYNELLELSVAMANEIFNVNVRINPDNHHIEII